LLLDPPSHLWYKADLVRLDSDDHEETTPTDRPARLLTKLADYLSLERNVSIASAAVFLLGLGEELWKKFLPKYLEALGASTPIIGLFGTAEDFFDASINTLAVGSPIVWVADTPS